MFLRTLARCYELSRNQWLKPEQLRKLQETRLRAIVKHAYDNVLLYKEKFDSIGIKPSDIRRLEDVEKIPFTTKREIREGIPDKSISKTRPPEQFLCVSTSGTSGGPMPVFYDDRFMEFCVANWHFRKYLAVGIKPWQRVMRIEYMMPDSNIPSKKEKLDDNNGEKPRSIGRTALGGMSYGLFNRRMLKVYIKYGGEDVIPDIVKFKPSLLHANPSYLRLVAETMKDKGIAIHPKAVRTGGEVTDESARQYLESMYECDVFDEYSTWDFGHGAWQCTEKEAYHIDADFLIMEVLRDNETAAPGERGQIVITSLLNYAMPMIRYCVGDVGIMSDEKCSCGRVFPLLKSVEGRIVDSFTLPNGMSIPPKPIMTVVQGTPGVSRYQVIQETRNKVSVQLMRKSNDQEVSHEELTRRLQNLLGEDVNIEIFFGDRENLKAKFRPVVSKMTVQGELRFAEPRGALSKDEREAL